MAIKQYILAKTDAQNIPVNGDGNNLWNELQGSDALVQLATVLPDPGAGDITTREDLTVPTPWSSVVSFDILLSSVIRKEDAKIALAAGVQHDVIDYGYVQDQAETDWRVLITLLALRKIRNIDISFESVQLTANNDFTRNILEQCPTNGLFGDTKTSWSTVTLIKLCGEVIGILTPTNLVCPRYYYSDAGEDRDNVSAAIRWLTENNLMEQSEQDEGYYHFIDPVDYIVQDRNYIPQQASVDYICAWMDSVKTAISTDTFQNNDVVVKLIDRFKSSIGSVTPVQNILTLRGNVTEDMLITPFDLIENIQGQHSLIGILTAMAYCNLSDYEVVFQPITADSPYKKYFNKAIFQSPGINAIILQKKDKLGVVRESTCLGALSDRYIVTVSNNPEKSEALIKCGLMSNGAEYNDPVDFVLNVEDKDIPKRYVYISKWMQAIYNALDLKVPNSQICQEISAFLTRLNVKFNAKFSAGTQVALEKQQLSDQNFVVIGIGNQGGSICDLFNSITATCDFDTTNIGFDISIVGTNQMVFSEKTIGNDLMNFYNKERNLAYAGRLRINKPEGSVVFATANVFRDKICYVVATADKEKYDDEWSIVRNDGKPVREHYSILWPINPNILNSLTLDSIVGKLTYEYNENEDKCILRFDCTLNNPQIASTIEKEYTGPYSNTMADHEIIEAELLPGLSIWPYVKNNGWYELYKSRKLKNPEGKDNSLDAEIMAEIIGDADWELASNADCERGVLYTNELPRCADVVRKTGENKSSLGWILFSDPEMDMRVQTAPHRTVNIALDFGTSSTAIYYSIGVNVGKVDFSVNNIYTPIHHEYDDADRYFIPLEYNNRNYYPTMLRISSNRPLMDKMMEIGNAVFKYEDCPDTTGINTSVSSDIKWSQDNNNQKEFLTQMIMHTIVYVKSMGCTQINWYASYPSAFSNAQLSSYDGMLNSIISDCSQAMNVTSTDVEFNTESIASASFLLTGGNPYMAVIDIGGGSTDISFWSKAGVITPLVQSSIKMASRAIFLNPLKEFVCNEKILQDCIVTIGGDNSPYRKLPDYIAAYMADKKDKAAANNYTTLIEQMVLNHSPVIMAKIRALPVGNSNRVKFEKKVTAGFFALIYYTLESIKSHINDIKLNIDFSLVGNGARLYDWIPDLYKRNIQRYIENWINENAAVPGLFNVLNPVSDSTAKTEAANGLLFLSNAPGIAVGNCQPSVLCGVDTKLEYMIGGVKQEPIYIPADKEFYSTDNTNTMQIIRNCYAKKHNYFATSCEISLEHADKLTEFRDKVGDVLAMILEPMDIPGVVGKANQFMNESFADGLIQSPLFCVIMAVIEQL